MRCLISVAVALLYAPGAVAGCAIQVSAGELDDKLDGALERLADLDIEAFKTESDAIQGIVPCVSEDLNPPLIATLHRVYGLRAFGESTGEAAIAFAAARLLEPQYTFPDELVQEGNPVLEEYASIDISERRTVLVPEPTEGSLRFDGNATLERSADWPSVVQIYDASQMLAETRYLLPGDRLPSYPGASKFDTKKLRLPLLGVAGVTGVTSIALTAVSGVREKTYKDPNALPEKELGDYRSTTNSIAFAGAASGVLALGSGVALVVVW